jgi:hypothetical protein
MTTPDGLVPLKAVVVPRSGAIVYSSPSTEQPTANRLPMFQSYFPQEQRAKFFRVGNDPTSEQSIGWVRANDVILWPTREALRPNRGNPDRKRLHVWRNRGDIGNPALITYDEDEDADPSRPYPVLEAAGKSYLIALTWQTADFSDVGVDAAWTQPLDVPDDVQFYYLTTRSELQKNFEQLNAALLDLSSGSHSEHPVVQLLKKNVDISVGEKVETGENDPNVLRRILRDLRNPMKIAEKQPAEIRAESANMQRTLARLRRFYQNAANWDDRGIGWLPADAVPGN